MYYPLNLNQTTINPLFGNFLKGVPYIFDFSSSNPKTAEYHLNDFSKLNQQVFLELEASNRLWGIGKYLEERKNLLRNYPNIIEEKRYYHLGLDIIVPFDTPIYSPLDGIVFKTGKENTLGNYGGYIILKHKVDKVVFYSFYGHLKTPHMVKLHDRVGAGQDFARIGQQSDSGGWFCHLHLQILTQKAINEGYALWGYAPLDFLPKVEQYFPSPYYLLRY